MKISELINELEATENYRKFKKKNPSTFFATGFFILNTKEKTKEIQLDFFIPKQNRVCPNQSKSQISEGKIAAFEYPFTPNTERCTEQCKEQKIFDEKIISKSRVMKIFSDIFSRWENFNWNPTFPIFRFSKNFN